MNDFDFNKLAGSFLDDLTSEVDSKLGTQLNVVEFAQKELNLGVELYPQQITILKMFYGLPLTDEEQAIKDYWIFEGKCTAQTDYSHQGLVLGLGRRASKCEGLNSLLISQNYGMIYGYELLNEAMSINNLSKVITNQETLMKLKDVTLPFNHIIAIEGKNKTATATNFYIKGQALTKKIITKCQYNLEATPEHRIKILDINGNIVWRYFSDIKIGEWACLHRNTNLFPINYLNVEGYIPSEFKYSNGRNYKQHNYPTIIDENQGRFLGLLVGDGSWTNDVSLEITLHEQDISFYKEIWLKANIDEPIICKDKRSQFGYRLKVHSKILREFYNKLGFNMDTNVDNKSIPWCIRRSPKSVQAAFLSSLFAADGCLNKSREVSLSTASKKLAEEVQLMLLNFGIVSIIRTNIVNNKNYYLVYVRGQKSLKIFVKDITFGLERKQKPLLDYLNKSSKDGGDTERIPNQKQWLQRVRDLLPSNAGANQCTYNETNVKQISLKQQFRDIVGNSIKENSEEEFSSYRLDAVIEFINKHITDQEIINHFNNLKECDYFYDPIVSVEDSEAFCVDLSVPGVEQYVSQGFTNHNSTLASIIVAYEFYKLCVLESPQEHYNISRTSWISILVIATTATQSKDTIFGSVLGVFENCRFFKHLESKGDLFIGTEYIVLKSKLIRIKSGNSKSAAQVGGNLIALVMDEFALFTSDEEESNAMYLWSALGISLSPFGYSGRRIALSSAICDGDAIEQLLNVTKHDSTIMTLEAASWEINPSSHPDVNPIVASEYAANPKNAALHFENKRSASEAAFLDEDEITNAQRGRSVIEAYNEVVEINGNRLMAVNIANLIPSNVQTFLHLDSSIKKDNYALVFGHVFTSSTTKRTLSIDGIVVWEPDKKNRIPVFFENVYETIIEIHKKRPLFMVSADPYAASAETMQKLKNFGIKTKVITFSNQQQSIMYKCLNNMLHEQTIVIPNNCNWDKLTYTELKNVLLMINGATVKIDHPSKFNINGVTVDGSKDIADCIATIAFNVVTEKLITVDGVNVGIANSKKEVTPTYQKRENAFNATYLNALIPKPATSAKDRYNLTKNYVRSTKRYL